MTLELTLELQKPRPAPTRDKLPEGWHFTEKYGEVFISPGGVAWVVKLVGDELKTVSVSITASDIIKTPATERLKHAKAVQRSRNRARGVTQPPNFGFSDVSGSKQAVMAGVK